MTDKAFQFVQTQGELEQIAELVADLPSIGVDAEMSGMHSYRTQVCLLQIATPTHELVIDTLAVRNLGRIGEILGDASVQTVLHGSVHDVRCLKADFGLPIHGLFDTYVAAQLLGLEKLGLGSLVEDRFDVKLDKELQTVDWRKRPLSDQQIEYLRADVRYLLPLGGQLNKELEVADLTDEARIEFGRIEAFPAQADAPDPGAWRKVTGCRDLDDEGQAVLRELWLLRDKIAREIDQPPGRMLRDGSLIDLVQARPKKAGDIGALRGFPRKLANKRAAEFLAAIKRGVEIGKPPPREKSDRGKAPDPGERSRRRAREEALRSWRKQEAAKRGVPTMAVLPTYALQDLVRNPPKDGEDLGKRPGIGKKRASRYSEAIRKACDK